MDTNQNTTPKQRLAAIIDLGDIPPPFSVPTFTQYTVEQSNQWLRDRSEFVLKFDSWCDSMLVLISSQVNSAIYLQFSDAVKTAKATHKNPSVFAAKEVKEMKDLKTRAIKDLEALVAKESAENEERKIEAKENERRHREAESNEDRRNSQVVSVAEKANRIQRWGICISTVLGFISAILAYLDVRLQSQVDELKNRVLSLEQSDPKRGVTESKPGSTEAKETPSSTKSSNPNPESRSNNAPIQATPEPKEGD